MPTYNENNAVDLKGLVAAVQGPVKSYIDAIDTKYTGAFRSLYVNGNTVNFYASNDHSGTAVATFDFPAEYFLQQTGTGIVENFTWSTTTYPNSTNPNLDGKTVFVMAVKSDINANDVKYSFVDMARVMKAITSNDNSLTVNGMDISVKRSATAGNLIELKSDGIYVGSDNTKADKVANATANNFAKLDANGNLADSGISIASVSDVTLAVNSVFFE